MDEKKKPFPWFYPLAILTLFLLLVLYFFIILVMVHSFLPQFVSFFYFLSLDECRFSQRPGDVFHIQIALQDPEEASQLAKGSGREDTGLGLLSLAGLLPELDWRVSDRLLCLSQSFRKGGF
jgi:hypothetical protein